MVVSFIHSGVCLEHVLQWLGNKSNQRCGFNLLQVRQPRSNADIREAIQWKWVLYGEMLVFNLQIKYPIRLR